MNRHRHGLTDREIESMLIESFIPVLFVLLLVLTILLTLAGIACAPAARPVLASTSNPISLHSKTAAASEQAGELAAYYREVF